MKNLILTFVICLSAAAAHADGMKTNFYQTTTPSGVYACSVNACVNDAYLNRLECERVYPERVLSCVSAYENEVRYCQRVCK